ncbi:multi-sensor signal transduction multi-kinase [Candidatus Magnetomorum sp. HK-1]|nr:multi-sensor signal transduction multi-kinase [Candidatus Magnetomorum sp. HK-1]
MIEIPNFSQLMSLYESPSTLIYRAIQERDNRQVILKMHHQTFPEKNEIERFHQEFKLIQSFSSKYIIKAIDLIKFENRSIIVFEDFEGDSLANLSSLNPFSLKKFLAIAIAMTEGLSIIHLANMIHNDINPSNIIYNTKARQIQIIDFGIASRVSSKTHQSDTIEGTLAYMAPEQSGRIKRWIDYRSDYYALGITFYELISGQLPFPTKDASELIHCHIAKHPIPPHQLNPKNCPKVLSDLIMKLISKSPEERYQSITGIQKDLKECMRQILSSGKINHFKVGQSDISDTFNISKKIYGREMYLNHLRLAFSQWLSSNKDSDANLQPIVRLITGNAGIGKTALIQEFHRLLISDYKDISTMKRVMVITGHCDQFQQKKPYAPIVETIQDLIKQILMENEAILSMLQRKIKQAIAPNGHLLISMIPDMKFLIGDEPVSDNLEAQATETQNRFHLAVQNFLNVIFDHQTALILFIDNLQWVDDATMQLIQFLCTSKALPLFFISAYREKEVDELHPVASCFDNFTQIGISVEDVPLVPIKLDDICMLIADTFHCSNEIANSLAETIMDKTLGNPFFITEFLQNLYDDKLIFFNHSQQIWEWDLQSIQNKSMTKNVVDRMIHRIKQMSSDTEKVLKLSACIGNSFSLAILKQLQKDTSIDMPALLNEAIEEGIIVESPNNTQSCYDETDTQYQFLHEQFQEAAYSMLSEEEIVATHWDIGQIMLANPLPEYQEQHLFDIVSHLNHSVHKSLSFEDQLELVRLNLMAGKKARASSAYHQSFEYLNKGILLLDSRSWQDYYDLTSSLYIEMIETCYYVSDFQTLNRLASDALKNISSNLKKVKIYEILILSSMAQNNLSEAIDIAISVLKSLNIRFPKKAKKYHVLFEIFRVRWMIAERRIDNLISHKPMTEPEKLAAMRILLLMTTASYYISSELRILVPLKMVWLSLKFGNSPISPFAYAVYGGILCSLVKQIDYGYLFGKLATSLLEHQKNTTYYVRTEFVINSLIRHWKEPVSATIDHALICYKNGLKAGDIEFAAISAHVYCYMSFHLGRDLVSLEKDMKKYSEEIENLHQKKFHQDNEINRKCVLNLMGRSAYLFLLGDHPDSEDALLDSLIESSDQKSIFSFYFNKLVLSYFFHDFQQAVDHADQARKYLDGVIGLYLYPLYIFYDSLARLAVFTSVNQVSQKSYLKIIRANQKKMKRWAAHAPMNHMHKYYMVEAEKNRVLGHDVQASDFYERAIQMAKTYQFIHEEALGYELAAKYYLLKGKTDLAKNLLLHARHCYMQWGAMAKVDHMDTRYHQFLTLENENTPYITPSPTLTSTTSSAVFDIATIMKAAQAISTEIILDRLLERLMKVIIENAGAQKGFLIFKKDSSLIIEAQISIVMKTQEKNTQPSFQFHLTSQNVDDCEDLSQSIVNYVARTGENVLLGDATNDGLFTNDVYVMNNRPRSLLCIPVKRHNVITGILYLENNYATEIFTRDRLEILQLLISQAAISIENAKFYEQLEVSEKKFRSLFENAVEGIFQLTPDGHLISANPSLAMIWGVDKPENLNFIFKALGKNVFVHTQDRKNLIKDLLKNQQIIGYETQVYRKDKSIIWISISARAVCDDDSNLLYYEGSLVDITSRKLAEDEIQKLNEELEQRVEDRTHELQETLFALKHSEKKYRGLYQSSKDAIILLTKDYRIQNANQAALDISGYDLEELTQLYIRDITPKKWIDIEKRITHEQVLKKGYSDEYEKEIIRKDGSLIPLSVRTWPLIDQKGNMTGIWSIARDNTERKRSERLREDVERIVRHDLKTPLNGIIGYAQLFNNYDQLTKELCIKGSSIIEKSAHNILHMIEHSLDIFKMEEGVYSLDPEPCNLIPLFHQLNESLTSLKDAGNLDLVFLMNGTSLSWEEEYMVMGEEVQLQSMFANLIKNALEASPDEETVTVSLIENKQNHEIIIHNMGIIPEEIREHFFERYATSGKSGGTGIGTYSALLIAKIHGGTITFTSTKEQGTSLIVHLPKDDLITQDTYEKQSEVLKPFKSCELTSSDINNSNVSVAPLPLPERKALIMCKNPIHAMTIQLFLNELQITNDFISDHEKLCQNNSNEPYDLLFVDLSITDIHSALETFKGNQKKDTKESPLIIGFHSGTEVKTQWQSLNFDKIISLNGLNREIVQSAIQSDDHCQTEKHILLAEDNVINRRLLMDMLSSYKITFDIVETGNQAVEAVKNKSYDAILMDIQMPRMDGIEATKYIRQIEAYNEIPIIAITAHKKLEENDPCIEAGMNDFISKPFQFDNIKRVMNQWLGILIEATTSPPPKKQSDLPDVLPGIFVREALNRVSGNKKILFELLDTFTDRYYNIEEKITQFLWAQKDKAIDEAHSLKGAAANLSMLDVSKLAAEIETTIENKSEQSHELLKSLEEKINIVLKSIDKLKKFI